MKKIHVLGIGIKSMDGNWKYMVELLVLDIDR